MNTGLQKIGAILRKELDPALAVKHCKFYNQRKGIIGFYCKSMRAAGFCRDDDKFCLQFYNEIKVKSKEALKAYIIQHELAVDDKTVCSLNYSIQTNQIKQYIADTDNGVWQKVKGYDKGVKNEVTNYSAL